MRHRAAWPDVALAALLAFGVLALPVSACLSRPAAAPRTLRCAVASVADDRSSVTLRDCR